LWLSIDPASGHETNRDATGGTMTPHDVTMIRWAKARGTVELVNGTHVTLLGWNVPRYSRRTARIRYDTGSSVRIPGADIIGLVAGPAVTDEPDSVAVQTNAPGVTSDSDPGGVPRNPLGGLPDDVR
jgi:hypothetical protein